ncbi:MAG TPA: hypothetical protein VHS03_14745 [Gaiellaceae bacterium]|nr:hypothetical protein [Gaiellaceae bacterium]
MSRLVPTERRDHAPDYVEPVRGWRTWLVVQGGDGARLASVSFPALWPRREHLTAECGRGFHNGAGPALRAEHPAPSIDCSCGIYAAGSIDRAAQIADCATARFRDCLGRPVLGAALGLVSLWGTIVDCAQGWRGAYAYPASIYVLEPAYSGRRLHVASAAELAVELRSYGVPAAPLGCHSPREVVALVLDEAHRAA